MSAVLVIVYRVDRYKSDNLFSSPWINTHWTKSTHLRHYWLCCWSGTVLCHQLAVSEGAMERGSDDHLLCCG